MTMPPLRFIFSSPTISAAASAMNFVSSSWFTSGGNRLRKSSAAVAPNPCATPSAMRRMRSSTRLITALLNERTVPRNTARSGMTLYASPAWIWVTLTTQVSTGRTLRETIDCKAVVMWLATTTGSIPDSGRAPCAPLPVIAISKNAPPAHIGPQPDRARRVADPQPSDEPGLADAAMHLDPKALELFGHQVGGALLLKAELGMGVDIAPPFGQLVVKAADLVDDRHGCSFGTAERAVSGTPRLPERIPDGRHDRTESGRG